MALWYVLMSKPRQESRLQEQLAQREIEAYLPLLPPRHAKRDPKGQACRPCPLFPRYLFAHLNVAASSQLTRWLPGLSRFVSFGEELVTVDDELIQHIRRRVLEMSQQLPPDSALSQAVRFRMGLNPSGCYGANHSFHELDAVFERPLADGQRAYVLIDALGHMVRCDVSMEDLEERPVRPRVSVPPDYRGSPGVGVLGRRRAL